MLFLLATQGTSITAAELLPSMVLVGTGNGLVLPSLVGSVLAGIKSKNAGAASGLLVTAQQFGGAAGVTVIGTVFFTALGSTEDFNNKSFRRLLLNGFLWAMDKPIPAGK